MEIKTLEQLQAVDERTLRFTPWGLGRLHAEDSAEFQQRVVARLELADEVAESTRNKFEQLRAGFSHGVLCYELFSLVEDAARLTFEQALRDRFVARYQDRIVDVRDRRGREHQVAMTSYPAFHEQFRNVKGTEIRMGAAGDWEHFNGMLGGLLRWARREGLLRGQRPRSLEPVQREMRNMAAHGSYHLNSPVDAARTLSDLAELINHLWGQPTPGGRLYPAPLKRDIIAIGWSKSGHTILASLAEHLASVQDEEPLAYILVRAVVDDPGLMEFDARAATTVFPSEYLWGPGTRAEAVDWLDANRPGPDRCDYLDQVVLVRCVNEQVDLPVHPQVATGLSAQQQRGTWYAVRVDRALDAFGHVRALVDAQPGHKPQGECRQCPAETLATGDIATVMAAAQKAGADTTALTVPDVRTPLASSFRCPAQ
ncbi:hypothetical protein [Streptomyces sp. NBC_01334]|uniref:hypothetical protein n=1 Tax=Streptomyces sp. NBC_01334 TaxID=2903827 RepID=UPI002E155661|nr:hypothetical protein OG736_43785 [Streptomyces sp. NBC_01334]